LDYHKRTTCPSKSTLKALVSIKRNKWINNKQSPSSINHLLEAEALNILLARAKLAPLSRVLGRVVTSSLWTRARPSLGFSFSTLGSFTGKVSGECVMEA
jgi:hypothetical protein